ncbi:hypothetical protein [Geodermatophilus marinus]|uniref:hypothetical protein n=1 Tax=Geodermatophilus sp. LHW52908 TaxID=2303986 RepID=UPI000E3EBB88|nr:hypothetical protein [Geodermatophilus sp. LHW52908]RFU22883.1 hypothetical protein D0Z06_03190 [Geodermatophilus sp. LHW52908]
MSMRNVKRVSFFCPTQPTGGPEAIHQASHALNRQGIRSDIIYVGGDAHIDIGDGRLTYRPPSHNPALEVYRTYEPKVFRGGAMSRQHLFVLPEVYAGDVTSLRGASVAIWWLSVDNAMVTTDEPTLRALFANHKVKHYYQSAYARDYLERSGVPTSMPLSDYTTPTFTELTTSGPNAETAIAFNPVKGADLSHVFFAAHPEFSCMPIRDMTKDEIVTALRRTMVYVDFGHLPGKDRLPREAAVSGAVVFVRRLGAGRFAEDFAMPDFFRFDETDVHSGELARRILAVHQDPAHFWTQQEALRQQVRGEQAELDDQLLALRGRRRAA